MDVFSPFRLLWQHTNKTFYMIESLHSKVDKQGQIDLPSTPGAHLRVTCSRWCTALKSVKKDCPVSSFCSSSLLSSGLSRLQYVLQKNLRLYMSCTLVKYE